MGTDLNLKVIGYSLDYYINKKYIGYVLINEPDRKEVGYNGRIKSTLENDVICTNKKKIKKGTEVITELIILYGRIENN